VFSYQNWQYVERPFRYQVPATDEFGQPVLGEDGQPVMTTVTESKVIKDCPQVELLPPENVRFHPAAKWYDPIGTSPYLQILWPMFVRDVKERMRPAEEGSQTVPRRQWRKLDDKDIAGAILLSPPLRRAGEQDLVKWIGSGKKLVALIPEHDEFLPPGPAIERFSALPAAEVIAVDGAKHLWVGESATKRVLNEIVRAVNPEKYPLPERF
jgi:hypothetical protein